MRRQLSDSPDRIWNFSENFEVVTIAGREYSVMRGEFSNREAPTEVAFQDGYAYRFVNTMILFLTTYIEDTKDLVNLFLSSIRQVQ